MLLNRCLAPLVFCLLLAFRTAGATPVDSASKYQTDLEEGIALLHSGARDDLSRAIAKFKSALKTRPESAEAYYWIALAYSDQNNYLRAADNAKDATIYDENFADAWLLWGQTLLYQKEW
ncbi:MAG: tetratricopeptide repeat protein, partial [Planctomycetota bacterium]|nr:tetratricopeptide repeat protein [Planctomycetota bacterium]